MLHYVCMGEYGGVYWCVILTSTAALCAYGGWMVVYVGVAY